jgi:glycosyltransferase involved in cell wall biosynthesis
MSDIENSALRFPHLLISSSTVSLRSPAPPIPHLTVVVPAYNEAARLPGTLDQMVTYFGEQAYDWRICVVDDGSSDGTAALARQWADREPRLTVIGNDHRGKAFAVRTGILAARSAYVAFSDADLSVPIREIERLLSALESGADVAIGSREGPGAHRYGEPAYRHLMGRVYNLLYRSVLLPGVSDSQCGFKAFRTAVAHDLFQRMLVYGADARPITGGMVTGFDTELLFLARRRGYRLDEIGVDWYYGKASKVRPVRDTERMIVDVFKIRAYAGAGRYGAKARRP